MFFFFSKSKGDLGHTDLIQHKINTGSAVPIRQPLRRLPYGKRQTEKEKILRMLDLGVIEPFIQLIFFFFFKLMLSFFFWRTTVYQIQKEKPNWNQVSPIKIEGQTSQWAKKNGQTSIDKRINRKTKDRVTQI